MVRPCSRRLQQLLKSAITYFLWLSGYLNAFHPFNLGPVTNFSVYTRATLLSLPRRHCWRTWHGSDRLNCVSGTWGFFCLGVCVENRHQTFSAEGLSDPWCCRMPFVLSVLRMGSGNAELWVFISSCCLFVSTSSDPWREFGTFHQQLFKGEPSLWAYWGRTSEPNQGL